MTSVFVSSRIVEAAPVGRENPLPPLLPLRDFHAGLDAAIADAEMAENLVYGHAGSLLPYTLQDGYGRDRAPQPVKTAVVENEVLRAEFLLDFGGRLWSLVHKPSGRELLHCNPILQPANLGLRNAWFAGGIEWNIGTIGHSPLTCAPLHAAVVERPDGTPMLRMWEFERLRELVFQIDAWLPADASALLVHVRVVNPNTTDTPLYWWSNIAVPQTPGTRVIVPADHAYHFGYDGTLRYVGVPERGGVDDTYPGRVDTAADLFYDIPDGSRRFIAALDDDGFGIVQTSTDGQRGRKLFRWGTSTGGTNWQDWLSGHAHPYLEIQAGLARTQLEHLRMPPGAVWSWIEAYGACTAEKAAVHGRDWAAAIRSVADTLADMVPRAALDAELAGAQEWAVTPPARHLHRGSGWGALARRMRERDGDTSLDLSGTPFDDSTIGRDQNSWLSLLTTGAMATPAPSLPPSSYTVGASWRDLLERHIATEGGTWFTWLHLGVNRYHAEDLPGAREAWERSVQAVPNAWALRNLAVLDQLADDHATAADRMHRAHRLAPRLRPLTVEALVALLAADRPADALALIDRLDLDDRRHGRIRLLECRAALDLGDLRRAKILLDTGIVVDDLREGEEIFDTLWWTYHEKRAAAGRGVLDPAARVRIRREHPLPCRYDYRMNETG
ncbi:DUF5107 domain-containing protein [Acrocarpospora catenulata]|uniref:DUF5107 domain-containing protein n=1 Tax=Acrocarpospora catenulata TaxID=2836182 RepID=UPI001BD9F1B5|nr:DUF5107 domain-containing protein [Acrocarpospora catenulata]